MVLISSGGFTGGGAIQLRLRPPFGRWTDRCHAVMLAIATFWSFFCDSWYSEYSKWSTPVTFW